MNEAPPVFSATANPMLVAFIDAIVAADGEWVATNVVHASRENTNLLRLAESRGIDIERTCRWIRGDDNLGAGRRGATGTYRLYARKVLK